MVTTSVAIDRVVQGTKSDMTGNVPWRAYENFRFAGASGNASGGDRKRPNGIREVARKNFSNSRSVRAADDAHGYDSSAPCISSTRASRTPRYNNGPKENVSHTAARIR